MHDNADDVRLLLKIHFIHVIVQPYSNCRPALLQL